MTDKYEGVYTDTGRRLIFVDEGAAIDLGQPGAGALLPLHVEAFGPPTAEHAHPVPLGDAVQLDPDD